MTIKGFNLSEDIDLKESFVCSFSPLLRLGVKVKNMGDKMSKLAMGVVKGIIEQDGVAESLKRDSIPGITQAVRQIDMKTSEGQLIVKGFVMWSSELKCWQVLLEGPSETYWEDQRQVLGKG